MFQDNIQMKTKSIVFLAIIASAIGLMFPSETIAESQTSENTKTITPLNDEISLQITTTTMDIPKDNTFPWGTVRGEPFDYVERYPVIIQFFKEEDPVHFAQVDVKGDGSYEYKFRVRNVDNNTGEIINIFEGKYKIKIFKVIHNQNDRV